MSDMKHTLLLCLAVFVLAACTQDELTDNPSATSQTLEIASATIARAEGDEEMQVPEPWTAIGWKRTRLRLCLWEIMQLLSINTPTDLSLLIIR